jgi:DNA-directed RNA polymerase subunit E'/Rpb7
MVDESDNTWTDIFNVTVEATKAQLAYDSYSVYSDTNGDKVVNKGETVELQILLKNAGTSMAREVKATFSSSSTYVAGFTPTTAINYGDIYAGNSNGYTYGYAVRFIVSNTTPADTQIPINIIMVDESGNTWTDIFNVTVKEPQIAYNSNGIYFDSNGDKIINKGETVRLKVSLKNIGISTANGVKATFSTNSSYISDFSPTTQINYGDISADGIKWANYNGNAYTFEPSDIYTIQFTVSNTTPAGTQIPIDINIIDASGNTWTNSFNVTVEATNAQIAYNSYSIHYDDNGDKIINKGETVQLKVSLKNIGTSTANSIKATFTTNSSYISDFSPTGQISYGDIFADGIIWADYNGAVYFSESYMYTYTIRFTVSNTTPVGTQIPINISMVDENNNTWTSGFNVTVGNEDADIIYDRYDVMIDSNGNGKIETGEMVGLYVYLKNIGSGTANAVKATFSTNSPYISDFSPTTPIDYGTFSSSVSNYGQGGYDFGVYYTIKFTVSSTAPTGAQLPINVSIVDDDNNTWTTSFNVTVQ